MTDPKPRRDPIPFHPRFNAAEERRVVGIEVGDVSFGRMVRCPWCRRSVIRHSPEGLSDCEAAFQAEMNRHLSGPLRVHDITGGRA